MSQRVIFNYVDGITSRVYVTPLIFTPDEDNPDPKFGIPAGNGYVAEGLTDEEWYTLSCLLERVRNARNIPLAKEEA